MYNDIEKVAEVWYNYSDSTLTLLVLPLIGMEMEGEVIEYGEPYNPQQPIIK